MTAINGQIWTPNTSAMSDVATTETRHIPLTLILKNWSNAQGTEVTSYLTIKNRMVTEAAMLIVEPT
jgi:hypothetical protein